MTPEDNMTSTQRTMRTVRNEHYPEALKERIEQGENIKSTHNVKKISFSKFVSLNSNQQVRAGTKRSISLNQ